MTGFSETVVVYPDTQTNVETPPSTLYQNGWIPKQIGVRGQPLPANWLNFILRQIYRLINRDKTLDGNGVGAIEVYEQDCAVTVHAIVKNDPTKFIHAFGYKPGVNAPIFKTLSSGTLALGTVTATDIPITGATAADVVVRVTVSQPRT